MNILLIIGMVLLIGSVILGLIAFYIIRVVNQIIQLEDED